MNRSPGTDTSGTMHLDQLTAMRLVDGEPVSSEARQHAEICPVCARLVDGFRVEAMSFGLALKLDDDEMAFLVRAGLPRRVPAFAGSPVAVHGVPHAVWTRRAGSTFLAFAAAAVVAAAGLVTSAPWLSAALDVARRAGILSAALQFVGGWLVVALISLWSVLGTVLSSSWNDTPALVLGIAGIVAAAAAWAMPAPNRSVAFPLAQTA